MLKYAFFPKRIIRLVRTEQLCHTPHSTIKTWGNKLWWNLLDGCTAWFAAIPIIWIFPYMQLSRRTHNNVPSNRSTVRNAKKLFPVLCYCPLFLLDYLKRKLYIGCRHWSVHCPFHGIILKTKHTYYRTPLGNWHCGFFCCTQINPHPQVPA